jgi:hypothetical protein
MPDAWYHASLQSLTSNRVTPSRVTLLSPQKIFDTSAPEIDIPEVVRVPVYQNISLPLGDAISEMHSYIVSLDPDISQDENGNGVYDDDFSTGGANIVVSGKSLNIGPFLTLGNREIKLKVTDDLGNIAYKNITLSVYAPIPSLVSASLGQFTGTLDEAISREPIDVFRVRAGSPLSRITTTPSLTNIE